MRQPDLVGDVGTGQPFGQRVGHAATSVRRHLGAAPAHRQLARVRADHGDARDGGRIEGQEPVVDEQHRALGGHLAGDGPPAGVVLLELVRALPSLGRPRTSDPFHQPQDVAHLLVHHGLVDEVVPDGGGERGAEPGRRSRHLEVEAGQSAAGDGRVRAEPVRHDEPVEAPFVAQDPVDEVGLLAAVDAVHLVVGGHHGPDAGLLYGGFEGDEVDLPQGALGDLGADRHPLVLLVVAGEVLDTAPDPLPLHPPTRRRRPGGPSAAGPRRRTRTSRPASGVRGMQTVGPSRTWTPLDAASAASTSPEACHQLPDSTSTPRPCRRASRATAARSDCRRVPPRARRTP